MRQINRLSDSVLSRLRSGTIFADIAQIADELVCNSIDAGATQIQVDVDIEACFLKVDDDGCGISRDDLTIVGERHATSKLQHLEELERGVKTLGFRGEALSSLSDIAVVELTSRCRGTPNTYRKILKDCATVSIGLCSQQRSHGTTVVVREMFYNQPVRRRLMSTSHRKILQSLKERIVRFILMHPNISFKVMDLARVEVSILSESAASLSTTLSGMFGEDLLLALQEVDCCEGRLRISGYLSRKYHCFPSKAVQFFYVNRRFVKKTPIHKLINKWAQSIKNGPRSMVGTSAQRRTLGGRGAGKQDGAPEKHLLPAFVFNLTCPLSEYDITFEASKTMVEFKVYFVINFHGENAHCFGRSQLVARPPPVQLLNKYLDGCAPADWLPVVAFVRSVLQSMWGNLSGAPEGGSGRSPELSMEVDSRSKIIRQQISSVPHNGAKNIPPMSVRRALVQGGVVDLSFPMRGSSSVDHRVHDSRQSRPRPRNSTSPAHEARGGRGERIYPSQTLSNASETSEKILKQSSSHGSDRSIPERQWTLASCRQGETLSKSVLSSVPYIDSASLTSPSEVERIMSFSEFSPITVSSSLVKTRTNNTSVEDLNYAVSAFVNDVKVENGGASPEVPDLNMGSMLWSVSDDSYNNLVSPDFSNFLSEVSSRPPNESDVQETFSRTFSKSGCDGGGLDAKDKFRTHKLRLSVSETYQPDNVSVDNLVFDEKWFPFKDCSRDVSLPGQCEGESFDNVELEGYKVSNHHEIEQPLMERNGGNDSDRRRPAYTSHQDESGKSSDSSKPPVKRKLEALFSGHLNNFCIRPDKGDDLEASKYDFDGLYDFDSCTSGPKRQRRRHSGPPFYKPPNRCGLHENPPNSLSTIKKGPLDIFEDDAGRERSETTGRASKDPDCLMEKTSDSSFSPSCSRKGLELNVDNALGRSHRVEDSLIRHLDTSEVTSVQLELPDITGKGQNEAAPSNDAIEVMFKEWSNPCMTDDGGVLDLSSGILCWNSISFLPDSIVKESLQHARVLPQVDKKFIPAVADGVLLIIDQHAADERVRLEELRDHVLGTGQMKQAAPLSCTQELKIAFTEQQMLQTYREQIEDWGWRFRLPSGQLSETSRAGSSVVGTCNVLLSAVPCILGVMLTGEDLTEYLRQLMDTQGSSAPPPAVVRVLNYKACRGAIMFGDTLLPAESRQLIEHLKQTSLCFQCAHGRPTMVPLVDLRALHKRLLSSDSTCRNVEDCELPSGWTARKSELPVKEWHGLESRRSCLERSLERRNRAKQ